MAETNEIFSSARIAGKASVNKALELLRPKGLTKTKRKVDQQKEKQCNVEKHCLKNLIDSSRKLGTPVCFVHTYALQEMRNALIHKDWTSMQQIFPLLLKCYYSEPIIWRYIFLIYICSPVSNRSHFQEFLEMCIGSEIVTKGHLLEQLIALQ